MKYFLVKTRSRFKNLIGNYNEAIGMNLSEVYFRGLVLDIEMVG